MAVFISHNADQLVDLADAILGIDDTPGSDITGGCNFGFESSERLLLASDSSSEDTPNNMTVKLGAEPITAWDNDSKRFKDGLVSSNKPKDNGAQITKGKENNQSTAPRTRENSQIQSRATGARQSSAARPASRRQARPLTCISGVR